MILLESIYFLISFFKSSNEHNDAPQYISCFIKQKKSSIGGALGYFILPLDVIPYFAVAVGYVDYIIRFNSNSFICR
ncbi:DUF1232 domain-containing protein [Saliterribacillus persicus]|uniref:DUF1232 domain-containing protein n=1 Tax=Saliterribacillus persicus TaxID=930114 RepID=UPI001FE64B0F|nr:DUF1232 domain-containing protein [Saliterribacillus persicus]